MNTSITTGKMVREYFEMKYAKNPGEFIYVGIIRQKLYHISGDKIIGIYDISTSRYGCGQENNSEKTPLGLHQIQSMVGDNAPIGGILIGNKYSGKNADIITSEVAVATDDVTTRALRLAGTEPGLNKGGKNDTFLREIYIHGTPEEGLIGKPVSHGCIRMRNKEIISLFEKVKTGIYVLILNN